MPSNKHDIVTEKDIELMVDSFYAKVNQDELLSYVFNDFAKVDWDEHLPKMYGFWNTLIFAKQSYKGNPFAAHLPLPIDKTHFDRWVTLFEQNIDELFQGDVAEQTKLRARSIAHIFQSKLKFLNKKKMKTANIYQDLEYNKNKPLISVLFETDFTKEIRIAMQKGNTMKEHKTSFPIVVEIVEGNIDFGVQQQVKKLAKGDIIALESNVPHDLKANENSIVRLTLTKNDNVKRVESVAIK